MKSSRNRLVLLGLICQGLSWDDYLLPLLYALGWALCLTVSRKPVRVAGLLESLLLVGGTVASHLLARSFDYSTHFSIGHGLALVQLARLMRPLNRREKLFSLLIALFQLAVACTFLFDYRFVIVLLAAVALLPKTLAEIEAGSFPVEGEAFPQTGCYSRPALAWIDYAVMVPVMLLFFLVFPRGLLTGGLRVPLIRPGDTATLMDTLLDPTTGASPGARRILFQVQGERLGYLKCYSLTHFDGRRWTPGDDYRWRAVDSRPIGEETPGVLSRNVRVKNPIFLGRVVPVDGQVVSLRGSFFRRAFQTRNGVIDTDYMWSGPINVYEYWIAADPHPERLRPGEIDKLTQLPPLSPPLQTWLEAVLAGLTNRYEQARRLERHFQTNFSYQLGAPDLNRLNPTEDFILRQKTGHCERFASALAALLRAQGIPTRVAIGYLPANRNWISGWYDIRLRDAHSWTEAWFPDRGWVQLDATPAASLPPRSAWSDWLEAIDFAWYAHVVNYDSSSQNALLQEAAQVFGQAAFWGRRHAAWLILALVPVTIWLAWRRLQSRFGLKSSAARREHHAQILAGHYYGRMLGLLAKRGWQRSPCQTPFEFLAALPPEAAPIRPEIEIVTRLFCGAKYGGHLITPDRSREIEAVLRKIRHSLTSGL